MACFIVPAAEAVVTAAVGKAIKKKEEKSEVSGKIPFSHKLGWLTKLLSGGSALLAFEHLWHGEISPFFPFLTAMTSKRDALEMLHEMGIVGVMMAFVCTAAWIGMLALSHAMENKTDKEAMKGAAR